jgi:hypothetical protein
MASKLDLKVECMSHAKFRQKGTKLSRLIPVIADEFHLFGGHGGQGWKKLDGLAKGLQAPIILASATPNYNDAERVYCIQHILDPHSCKGGYLEFLYRHCNTEQNPFGQEPLVDKDQPFRNYVGAPEYLAALPNVYYLPDDLVYQIQDIAVPVMAPVEFYTYGLNERRGRIIASGIEEKHAIVDLSLVGDNGQLWPHIYGELGRLIGNTNTPVLVFAAHKTVAQAFAKSMHMAGVKSYSLITGDTPLKAKAAIIKGFNEGGYEVLVGTASLATGTDGMDKVCDTLIILDDTEDDAQRRQLIGRIMPRGQDTDASKKNVYRLVLQ